MEMVQYNYLCQGVQMLEVNLEEGRPFVAEAMENLKFELKNAKNSKIKVIVFIHGYGSSGSGGAICKSARQWLKAQVRNGSLKSVVDGTDFGMFNAGARKIRAMDSDTQKYYDRGNNGITVVEV